MNADFLASKVYYDETSPTCLRWKETRYSAQSGIKIPITYADSVAGVQSEDPKRYSVVRIEGCNYSVHRVIYVLMVGEIPDRHVVNHIDGNIKNNRISNLEVCTQTENCRRKKFYYFVFFFFLDFVFHLYFPFFIAVSSGLTLTKRYCFVRNRFINSRN